MDIDSLEELLSDFLPSGFKIQTNKKGHVIILTGLMKDDDGELVSIDSDEDDEESEFDSDFESLDSLEGEDDD